METVKLKSGLKYREVIIRGGKRIKSPSFKRKTDAKSWKAEQVLKRDKEKLYGLEYKDVKKVRLLDFANSWLEEQIKPQKTHGTYTEYLRAVRKKIVPIVENKYLHKVLQEDAHKLIGQLGQNGHNKGGINKILGIFKQVMKEAEKRDLIVKNPLMYIANLKEEKRSPTYWQESDVRIFLLYIKDSYLYDLYIVALNTGMRRGELFGLQWDKIDFNNNMIEVSMTRDRFGLKKTTKSKKTRFVPMNSITRAVLLNLQSKMISSYIFTRPCGEMINPHHASRKFKQDQKKAGIKLEIRFHDLRHTFASHFMMNGGNLYDLQKVLGHSKAEMTQIYAHLSSEHLSKTTEILSFGAVENKPTPRSTQDNISFI